MIVIKEIYGKEDSIETIISEYNNSNNVKFLIGVDNEYQKVEISIENIVITKKDKSKETINVKGIENILYYIFGYIKKNNIFPQHNINKKTIDEFIQYISKPRLDINTMSKDEIITNIYELYKNDKIKLLQKINIDIEYYKSKKVLILNIINNNKPFEANLLILKDIIKELSITQKDWNTILSDNPKNNKLSFDIINNYFDLNLEKELNISKSLFSYIIKSYISSNILKDKLHSIKNNVLEHIYINHLEYDNDIVNIYIERKEIPSNINILNIFNKENITKETKTNIIKTSLTTKHKILLLKNNFDDKDFFFNNIIASLENNEISSNLDDFVKIKEKLTKTEHKNIIDNRFINLDKLDNNFLTEYLSIENQLEYHIIHNTALSNILNLYSNTSSAHKYILNNYDFNINSLELFNLSDLSFIKLVIDNNKINDTQIIKNIESIINKSDILFNDEYIVNIINKNYNTISKSISNKTLKKIIHILNDTNFLNYLDKLTDNEKIELFITFFESRKDYKFIIENLNIHNFTVSMYYKISVSKLPIVKIISLLANSYDKNGALFIQFLIKANDNTILLFKDFIEHINIDKTILFDNIIELYSKIITIYSKIEGNQDTILFFKPFNFLIDVLGEFINEVKDEALKINNISMYTAELKAKVDEVNLVNKNIQDKIIKEKESLFNQLFKSKEDRRKIIEDNKSILFTELNKKKDKFIMEFDELAERKKEIDQYIKNMKFINERLLQISEKISTIVKVLQEVTNINNPIIEKNFLMLKENFMVFNTLLTTTSSENIIAMQKSILSMDSITALVEKIVLMFNNKIDYLIFNKDINELEIK